MDVRNLQKLLLGNISVAEIVDDIESEVESFRIAHLTKGCSMSVLVSNEDFDFAVRPQDIKHLCSLYMSGDLNGWHLEDLSNVIEMSDAFTYENDDLADVIFELSSPEIHSALTPQVVKRIHESL